MRAAPIGLLAGPDTDRLVRVAVEQSRITHRDPRCAAGAVAMAAAARAAARGGPLNVAAFAGEVAELAGRLDGSVAAAIELAAGWAPLGSEQALAALAEARLDPASPDGRLGISGHVVPTVAWAMYAFLRFPDSWIEAVATAIEVGGDTDTMGAMAGALAGARLGAAALPAGLVGRLNDRGEWGREALTRLAQESPMV
jgi:ADP-ribosylglycohydrolase